MAVSPRVRWSRPSEERELGFCLAESWEREKLGFTPWEGPANTEPCITKAQAPGSKEAGGSDLWVWGGVLGRAGPRLPVSPVGERRLGDRSPESLRGEGVLLLLGNCGELNRVRLCQRAWLRI